MAAASSDRLFNSPEPPSQLTGHVAISLGFGASFGWEMALTTVWSFHKSVLEVSPIPTSLVVLSDTPHLLERHRRAVPRLIVQSYDLSALQKLEGINRNLEPADAGWFRFPLQATFVERYCQQADLVLLFDLKDVYFQSSPFALAPRAAAGDRPLDTLTSFTEMWKLRRGSWNHNKMTPFARAYPNLVDTIIDRRVLGLNDGLLMGPPRVVSRYVRELTRGFLGLTPRPKVMEGLDQGLHNLLVYRSLLQLGGGGTPTGETHHVIEMNLNATCPVLTMHMLDCGIYTCEGDLSAPGSSLFRMRSRMSGEAFVMVHQWNRAPETVQRAVLCAHRHLLNLSHVTCGPRTSCHPCQPEKRLVRQDEREVLQKFAYPRSWKQMCPVTIGPDGVKKKACITAESDRVTML